MSLHESHNIGIIKSLPKFSVQLYFMYFIEQIESKGYTVYLTSGYRTTMQQEAAYKENKLNAKPGHSLHQSGMAIDLNLIKNGQWLRKKTSTDEWIRTGIPDLAKDLGIRWGGRFHNYADNVHFDLLNISSYFHDDVIC